MPLLSVFILKRFTILFSITLSITGKVYLVPYGCVNLKLYQISSFLFCPSLFPFHYLFLSWCIVWLPPQTQRGSLSPQYWCCTLDLGTRDLIAIIIQSIKNSYLSLLTVLGSAQKLNKQLCNLQQDDTSSVGSGSNADNSRSGTPTQRRKGRNKRGRKKVPQPLKMGYKFT